MLTNIIFEGNGTWSGISYYCIYYHRKNYAWMWIESDNELSSRHEGWGKWREIEKDNF